MNTDKNTEKEATPAQLKRRILSQLSREADDLKKKLIGEAIEAGQDNKALYWAAKTINFMLLNHIYETDGAKEFKTFMQWKHEGATIKKGAKAFIIWGQPLGSRSEDQEKGIAPEDEDNLFFPLCFLFSENQVIKPADRVKPEAESQEPEKVLQESETITDNIF